MTLKTITLGLAALLTLGSATAFAAPPDIQRRQAEIRTALDGFNFGLSGDRVNFTREGRRDLVAFSNKDRDVVVRDLKAAYKSQRALPNGFKVAGWAHIDATDTYTFTFLNQAKDHYVAEVAADPQGTRVMIWGHGIAFRPERRPLSEIPRRFAPAGGDAIMR